MSGQQSQEFALLGEEDWESQAQQDENALQSLLNASADAGGDSGLLDLNRPLDIGEKADDALDYEDFSDDDLPDEEEPSGAVALDLPGLIEDGGMSHDTDDLFGEGRDSSPLLDDHDDVHIRETDDSQTSQYPVSRLHLPSLDTSQDFRDINFDPEPKISAEANQDLSIPAPAESMEDLIQQSWPTYQKGSIINFTELLPPKKARYLPKKPLKTPKPVNPTKVSLDLATDQEKSFRTAGPASSNKRQRVLEAEARGLVAIIEESPVEGDTEPELDWSIPSEYDTIGGVSWNDLQIICDDWDLKINADPNEFELLDIVEPEEVFDNDEDAAWHKEFGIPAAKKQKLNHAETDILNKPAFDIPSFDNFEIAITQFAKRVTLDLNDPHLLIDVHLPSTSAKRKLGNNFKRGGSGSISKSLSQRFNISNDEAYDALKENHQNKVRATIGNLSVEHSTPALKLQWPYYRVKLHIREARTYHRPALKFNKFLNTPITFSKPAHRKRKHMKGLSTQDIFKESKDLSLADNSTALLLEYSEEHPTVLSNFGMGNRIVNYYRRQNADDNSRPKIDIGETTVLMPEDRSPFAQFGNVDPGETVPTLHNAMYRAPIFKHDPKHTDFIIIRSTTGVGGTSWHLRNIDHMHVVGQQLPSVEIPGPQSRKVTNAAKNRMKMIAFRKLRHSKDHSVTIESITEHISDSTVMQNRQKLKEFMRYHKDEKVWRVKPGDIIPDEPTVRSWVKPEDVCTIDAMQVGLRHLEDAGYGKDNGGDDSEEEKEGDSLEQRLAPWKTSKNFIDASAGKAMLVLHGEGDPSGHGLAFSFIKTSMKGGYLDTIQGPQATTEDAIARQERERKANGGHKYNVDRQNEIYSKAIRGIWDMQKANLSNVDDGPDNEIDHEHPLEMSDPYGVAPTSHSAATPANFDDSASQISRYSTSSRQGGKVHKIIRVYKDKYGRDEERVEIVKDARVWREYMKRRHAIDAESQDVYALKPTGDAEYDKKEAARVKKELLRLERNKERRHAREKQKGIFRPSMDPEGGSPSATPAPVEKQVGTTRKCANCGQMGHIKTNKKLCPMLNGTMKPEDTGPDHGFGAVAAPSFN